MKNFTEAIADCIKRGDLTISDLARWFDRPRPTVNTWVSGRIPYGPSSRLAFERVALLQEAVRNKDWFPIPARLTWTERAEYMQEIRDAVARKSGRVPGVRATG